MDFDSINDATAIPAVAPEDLRRVWHLMQKMKRASTTAISSSAIAWQSVSENPDPIPTMIRCGLVQVLSTQGLLEYSDDKLPDTVLNHAATFPLPDGVAGFDPGAFLIELKR